jgi:hypothetical protein
MLLISLLLAHFLADYPLQGDFLSRAKNPMNPIPGVPWYQAMFAHCFIHAAFVALLTDNLVFGVAELVIHFVTDRAKCYNWLSFNEDQAIHLTMKLAYFLLIAMGITLGRLNG